MPFVIRRSVAGSLRRFSSKVPPNGNIPQKNGGVDDDKGNAPKAGAPPMPDLKLDDSNTSLSEPYQPKDRYQRVSFEYPTESKIGSTTTPLKLRKYLPHLLLLLGGGWALYTVNYFSSKRVPTDFLNPDEFIPFYISNKVDVDKDHYLIELTPKFNKWKADAKKADRIWNGGRLWSVEVKQPQIMVVRKYTPLPLTIYQGDKTKEPLINLQSEEDLGKMVLYVKKYDQGEVARWIYKKPLGSELELRGPFIEYEFERTIIDKLTRPQMQSLPSAVQVDEKYPIKPDNMAFFAGGTGIAPILQCLLSKNPYKGHVDLYYSRRTESEIPIPRFLYFLEKLGRVKVHSFINEQDERLNIKDIPPPIQSHYKKFLEDQPNGKILPTIEQKVEPTPKYRNALDKAFAEKGIKRENPALALVCGPDGFVNYLAGPKPYNGQGPVGGLLKKCGWDESNVYKL